MATVASSAMQERKAPLPAIRLQPYRPGLADARFKQRIKQKRDHQCDRCGRSLPREKLHVHHKVIESAHEHLLSPAFFLDDPPALKAAMRQGVSRSIIDALEQFNAGRINFLQMRTLCLEALTVMSQTSRSLLRAHQVLKSRGLRSRPSVAFHWWSEGSRLLGLNGVLFCSQAEKLRFDRKRQGKSMSWIVRNWMRLAAYPRPSLIVDEHCVCFERKICCAGPPGEKQIGFISGNPQPRLSGYCHWDIAS